jgi:hypothetical protein
MYVPIVIHKYGTHSICDSGKARNAGVLNMLLCTMKWAQLCSIKKDSLDNIGPSDSTPQALGKSTVNDATVLFT